METFGVVLYAYFGIDTADLAEHGHRVGLAKFVAVELTCRLAGWNQRAVGQRYGGMSSAAVSTIRRKIREGHYEVTPVRFPRRGAFGGRTEPAVHQKAGPEASV